MRRNKRIVVMFDKAQIDYFSTLIKFQKKQRKHNSHRKHSLKMIVTI